MSTKGDVGDARTDRVMQICERLQKKIHLVGVSK